MIPKIIKCSKCGAEIKVDSWRKFTVCKYCGNRTDFEGFEYVKIKPGSSEYASVKKEMDCPKCRSPHMLLFSSKWRCIDCGYTIGKLDKAFEVFWFCDDCGAYLNTQSGFTTKSGKWECTECEFKNGVSKKDIL